MHTLYSCCRLRPVPSTHTLGSTHHPSADPVRPGPRELTWPLQSRPRDGTGPQGLPGLWPQSPPGRSLMPARPWGTGPLRPAAPHSAPPVLGVLPPSSLEAAPTLRPTQRAVAGCPRGRSLPSPLLASLEHLTSPEGRRQVPSGVRTGPEELAQAAGCRRGATSCLCPRAAPPPSRPAGLPRS